MTREIINKTMSRGDLMSPEAAPVIDELNSLIRRMYRKRVCMSSWIGTLRAGRRKRFMDWLLRRVDAGLRLGVEQRLDYEPLPGAADDLRIPWFLYWEIFWVMKVAGPLLTKDMRLLDGGGASSLFSCHLASLGYEVHTIDLNKVLIDNDVRIAKVMGWNLHSYEMNLARMSFPDKHFDHAFSICVFEHLDYDLKQAALAEIARCLKPSGTLSLTFDYRNPAPGVVGIGKDPSPRNAIGTKEDIARNFLSTGHFELIGNPDFQDNGENYLLHPKCNHRPYTFGAIFLRRKG